MLDPNYSCSFFFFFILLLLFQWKQKPTTYNTHIRKIIFLQQHCQTTTATTTSKTKDKGCRLPLYILYERHFIRRLFVFLPNHSNGTLILLMVMFRGITHLPSHPPSTETVIPGHTFTFTCIPLQQKEEGNIRTQHWTCSCECFQELSLSCKLYCLKVGLF